MPARSSLARASLAAAASANAPACTTNRAPVDAAAASSRARVFLASSAVDWVASAALSPGLSCGLSTVLSTGFDVDRTTSVSIAASLAAAGGTTAAGSAGPGARTTSAGANAGVGISTGLPLSLSGISMGISSATGRGWVSKTKGKPITPARTRAAAPTRRCRARWRRRSRLSPADAGGCASESLERNLKKAIGKRKFRVPDAVLRVVVIPAGGRRRPYRTIRTPQFYQRGLLR